MRRTRATLLLATVLCGTALGFTVSNLGFGDYTEVHRMFTFQDLRMFYAFLGAVAIATILSPALLGRPGSRAPIHVGIPTGALLFGAGWAVSGGCPAIPIIQVASGYTPALASIAGIIVGVRTCRWFTTRHLPIDRGPCG